MATISPHGKGWRAQIRRRGFPPLSKTFPRKGQAYAWAEKVERELVAGRYNPTRHTLLQGMDRYRLEVSPRKGGARWEALRLVALGRHPTAAKPMGSVSSDDIGRWRDDSLAGRYRRRAVSGPTVRREMNLLESVFEVARKEWKWIEANPVKDAEKPPKGKDRRRRVRDEEIDTMREALDGPVGREVFDGFELGIETAMRAGEMWSLERPQIDLRRRVAHLDKTKNGDERDVALSRRAVAIMRRLLADDRDRLFINSNESRDRLWRKARDRTDVVDLHFHDSRSEAIWRLSKQLDVLELAEQTGHRDIKSLMFYYRDSAAERAKKLTARPRKRPSPGRRSTAAVRPRTSGRASGTRDR